MVPIEALLLKAEIHNGGKYHSFFTGVDTWQGDLKI